MKTLFLLSHTPIPRFIKRIKVACEENMTKVVYWDREVEEDIKFTLPDNVDCESIKLKAPQGNPLRRSLLLIKFGFKSLSKIINFQPVNIHVGNLDMLLIACIYKQLFNKKLNIIYEVGDLPEITFKKNLIAKIYKRLEKALLQKINYLIVTSPFFWEEYYKNITEKSKYYLIPNVPSVEITNYKKESNPSSILDDNITIGFIGSVRYESQLKMLIDIVKSRSNVNLLIAGSGKSLETIRNYSVNYSNIKFTGSYDYKEIGFLYDKVDVIYSVYDSNKRNVKIALPNRLYESILFEKPLIVSAGTELGKFVVNKGIGYVVSDSNPHDLENLVIEMSENHSVILDKKNNFKKIKNEYYYEEYVPIVKSLYKQS